MTTLADSNKPFLDYLDKEMTIQGILSAFCVGVAGVVFDRVLGLKDASAFIQHLQQASHIFIVALGAGLLVAAGFFYLQRSRLAWLSGQISFAVTCGMQDMVLPEDTNRLEDALAIGNSWSLWNSYKFGISFIFVGAAELGLAILFAEWMRPPSPLDTATAGGLFLAAGAVDLILWRTYRARDLINSVPLKQIALAKNRRVGRRPTGNRQG